MGSMGSTSSDSSPAMTSGGHMLDHTEDFNPYAQLQLPTSYPPRGSIGAGLVSPMTGGKLYPLSPTLASSKSNTPSQLPFRTMYLRSRRSNERGILHFLTILRHQRVTHRQAMYRTRTGEGTQTRL